MQKLTVSLIGTNVQDQETFNKITQEVMSDFLEPRSENGFKLKVSLENALNFESGLKVWLEQLINNHVILTAIQIAVVKDDGFKLFRRTETITPDSIQKFLDTFAKIRLQVTHERAILKGKQRLAENTVKDTEAKQVATKMQVTSIPSLQKMSRPPVPPPNRKPPVPPVKVQLNTPQSELLTTTAQFAASDENSKPAIQAQRLFVPAPPAPRDLTPCVLAGKASELALQAIRGVEAEIALLAAQLQAAQTELEAGKVQLGLANDKLQVKIQAIEDKKQQYEQTWGAAWSTNRMELAKKTRDEAREKAALLMPLENGVLEKYKKASLLLEDEVRSIRQDLKSDLISFDAKAVAKIAQLKNEIQALQTDNAALAQIFYNPVAVVYAKMVLWVTGTPYRTKYETAQAKMAENTQAIADKYAVADALEDYMAVFTTIYQKRIDAANEESQLSENAAKEYKEANSIFLEVATIGNNGPFQSAVFNNTQQVERLNLNVNVKHQEVQNKQKRLLVCQAEASRLKTIYEDMLAPLSPSERAKVAEQTASNAQASENGSGHTSEADDSEISVRNSSV